MKVQFNSFLKVLGLQIKRIKSLNREQEYYQGIINGAKELYKIRNEFNSQSFNAKIAGLAFSKDRPLQLHALLNSYFKLVSNAVPIDVIYKASTEKIDQYYNELAGELDNYPVRFIKEIDFYSQVITWLKKEDADRVFFLTDDAVFLEEMDLNDCLNFNPYFEIFTVTHGKDLDYSFAFDRKQELPEFETIVSNNGTEFLKWSWNAKLQSPEWSYPLSVDSNIFSRKEMFEMCNNIQFRNPNSLEGGLQVFKDFFISRKGICYTKVKMINVPCNVVQTEYANRHTGLFTAEELLDIWNQNKRIVTNDFYQQNARDAMNSKYSFLEKE